jgi:hypothetical protein
MVQAPIFDLYAHLIFPSSHRGHGFEVSGHKTQLNLPQIKSGFAFGIFRERRQVGLTAADELEIFRLKIK